MFNFDLEMIILRLAALLPALTLHEFAHGYSAHLLGDPTPRLEGRLTLNPLAHLDPIGTLMIIFAPIGWAKPVRINPSNFRDPEKGNLITSAAGPAANILQGTFWALILRLVATLRPQLLLNNPMVYKLLLLLTLINFVLAFFNLIPLGPLDGHHILEYYLPYDAKLTYYKINQYGFAILIGLIFLNRHLHILTVLIFKPARTLTGFLSGIPL